jgi:hypothetical protein
METATGSATIGNSTWSDVTGASVNINSSGVNYVFVLSSFQVTMTSSGNDDREANFRIVDDADATNINSGEITRSLAALKAIDFGIGSQAYIFDISAYSNTRTYTLQHQFTNAASRNLTTNATIIAMPLKAGTYHLQNETAQHDATETMTDSWASIPNTETSVITTTIDGGFYVTAAIDSKATTYTDATTGTWKLQYKKGAGGTWTDFGSPINRSVSNNKDIGIISLVGYLSDANTAGDYYFRVSHKRSSGSSTMSTEFANINAIFLATADGAFPIVSKTAATASTTSATAEVANNSTYTPDANTDLFMHTQFTTSADDEIDEPVYELTIDGTPLTGSEMKRSLKSSSDNGAGVTIGLATGLISGTDYSVDFSHISDGTTEITTTGIVKGGFGLSLGVSIALPITLSEFEIFHEYEDIIINWTTSSEINNDYFEIQRSENGYEFETIEIVQGAGNSSSNIEYSFIDDFNTPQVYYRLKQVDYDGEFSFSKIVSLNSRLNSTITYEYNNSNLWYENTSSTPGYSCQIVDYNGTIIKSFELSPTPTPLKLTSLEKGIYIIRTVFNGNTVNIESFAIF